MQGSVTPDSNRAANLVVIVAVLASVVCLFLGAWDLLRANAGSGWLLIALGILPLVLAGLVRSYLVRGPRG